jgi:nucleotide-binding universal stress UspA family protein
MDFASMRIIDSIPTLESGSEEELSDFETVLEGKLRNLYREKQSKKGFKLNRGNKVKCRLYCSDLLFSRTYCQKTKGTNLMTEIKKIIWATDGSKESEEALRYAKFFAQRFNSEIIGIHIIPMNQRLLYDYYRDPESNRYRWVEKAEEDYMIKLVSIAHELTAEGINFRGRVLRGEPTKSIVEFARSEKANLIVMGKRGIGLKDRLLIGSTTLRVLRESSVPVLAVKKRDKEGAVDIRSILVPLDIDEKLDSALNYAIDLTEKINASISVVYVLRLDIYDYGVPSNIIESLERLSSNELEKRIEEIELKRGTQKKEVTELKINAEMIQRINPSVAIADYASDKNIDLIVTNTHGRKGIRRLILGSVAEKIIQESTCAVLVLKP